jgi:hypothetical protein
MAANGRMTFMVSWRERSADYPMRISSKARFSIQFAVGRSFVAAMVLLLASNAWRREPLWLAR